MCGAQCGDPDNKTAAYTKGTACKCRKCELRVPTSCIIMNSSGRHIMWSCSLPDSCTWLTPLVLQEHVPLGTSVTLIGLYCCGAQIPKLATSCLHSHMVYGLPIAHPLSRCVPSKACLHTQGVTSTLLLLHFIVLGGHTCHKTMQFISRMVGWCACTSKPLTGS